MYRAGRSSSEKLSSLLGLELDEHSENEIVLVQIIFPKRIFDHPINIFPEIINWSRFMRKTIHLSKNTSLKI